MVSDAERWFRGQLAKAIEGWGELQAEDAEILSDPFLVERVTPFEATGLIVKLADGSVFEIAVSCLTPPQ
jgi:hypothetical protein